MAINPKYRHYINQAFAFGLVWYVFGLVLVIVEKGILGDLEIYPATGNGYDFKNNLIYVPFGCFVMGFFQGWIEMVWLEKKFLRRPFIIKILFKGIIYFLMIIAFLAVLTLIVNSIRANASIFDPEIVQSLVQFITSFAFWSLVIYAALVADIALFFAEVRQYLGDDIFYHYSFGTYFNPNIEFRIFMFLDMKSSTSIAEKMGHKRYFELIKMYYGDMTDAILETSGEIYQYVGDEIVVSWPERNGLHRNNCLNCFFKISEGIQKNAEEYRKIFGFVPEFKAGLHLGEVTTGEIGTLKKDIIYTGDVLNTAARIQGLCNTYEAPILISGSLKAKLHEEKSLQIEEIGSISLRGISQPMPIFKVEH